MVRTCDSQSHNWSSTLHGVTCLPSWYSGITPACKQEIVGFDSHRRLFFDSLIHHVWKEISPSSEMAMEAIRIWESGIPLVWGTRKRKFDSCYPDLSVSNRNLFGI